MELGQGSKITPVENRPKLNQDILLESDALDNTAGGNNYNISFWNVVVSTISIVLRPCVIVLNVYLVYNYHKEGEYNYSAWTATSVCMPMCVTTVIYLNMLKQDNAFLSWDLKTFKQIIFFYFFRDWFSWLYARNCRKQKMLADREQQMKYFKLYINEESDLAFIKLFDTFLESATQKILQITVVLQCFQCTTNLQILSICMYFGNMAWCLAAYNRSSRLAQIDKENIDTIGFLLQLIYNLCLSVTRTLCIAFVASIFPMPVFALCLTRIFIFGCIIYYVDRPHFSTTHFNCFLSFVMGIVYLFTLIPINDAPTRWKYLIYHIICGIENIACIVLFLEYVNDDFIIFSLTYHSLCAIAIFTYVIGLLTMVSYYKCFHPQIIARNIIT